MWACERPKQKTTVRRKRHIFTSEPESEMTHRMKYIVFWDGVVELGVGGPVWLILSLSWRGGSKEHTAGLDPRVRELSLHTPQEKLSWDGWTRTVACNYHRWCLAHASVKVSWQFPPFLRQKHLSLPIGKVTFNNILLLPTGSIFSSNRTLN